MPVRFRHSWISYMTVSLPGGRCTESHLRQWYGRLDSRSCWSQRMFCRHPRNRRTSDGLGASRESEPMNRYHGKIRGWIADD